MAIDLFDKNLSLIDRSMSLRAKRNSLLASNIANRETPGYRAQDLVFDKQLGQALNSDQPGPLKVTDHRHFDGVKRESINDVEGMQINSFNPDPRMDGNTVDLDKEMAKLAENQLMYRAAVRSASWKFRMLKSAISER